MATSETDRAIAPAILPEDSVLSFEEYMAMQRAIGQETRFRIVHYLKHRGETSPTELKEAFDLRGNALHHHLNKLVEVGLVHRRARSEADSDGLFTYYRASGFGSALLEYGLETVMKHEHEYRATYEE